MTEWDYWQGNKKDRPCKKYRGFLFFSLDTMFYHMYNMINLVSRKEAVMSIYTEEMTNTVKLLAEETVAIKINFDGMASALRILADTVEEAKKDN